MRFIQFLVGGSIFLLLFFQEVKAQENWTDEEKEKYAVLSDDYIDPQESEEALEWLMIHNPSLHENIYISGAGLYKEAIDQSTDEQSMTNYYEKLMELYDKRLQYFGNDKNVLSRKLTDAYLLGKPIQNKTHFKLMLYDSAFQSNQEAFSLNLLAAFMDIAKEAYQEDLINREEFISRYFAISKSFTVQQDEENKVSKYQSIVDRIFLNAMDLECNEVEEIFSDDLMSEDISRVKMIIQLSIDLGCTKTDLFNRALAMVYDEEPTLKMAEILAKKAEGKKEFGSAEKYYLNMVSMAVSKDEKAEALLETARYYQRRGNKSKSRAYALKSINAKADNPEAYDLLGDLYFYSYNECTKGKSRVLDRCVFLLAYEMYQKAGNTQKMKESAMQFPAMENIHQENFSEGEEITCSCWMNEKVKIRRRVEE